MKKYIIFSMFIVFFTLSFSFAHGYDQSGYYGSREHKNQKIRSYYGCYPYCENLDRGGKHFNGLTPDSSWLQRPYYIEREYRKDRYRKGRDWDRDRGRQKDYDDRRHGRKYRDRN